MMRRGTGRGKGTERRVLVLMLWNTEECPVSSMGMMEHRHMKGGRGWEGWRNVGGREGG